MGLFGNNKDHNSGQAISGEPQAENHPFIKEKGSWEGLL